MQTCLLQIDLNNVNVVTMAMAMNLLRNSWIVTLVVIGAMIASSHPIFINLSKVNGKIPFTSTSVALMIELAKVRSLFHFRFF